LKSLGLKGLGEYKGPSKDEDSVSEAFTARTGETDLDPLENILDLTIFDIEFYHQIIA
jgi:hypothetical protein